MNAPTFTRLLRRALFLVAAPAALFAQGATPALPHSRTPAAAGDSAIRITLLTMGQGDEVYEMFGHNAIWIHDPGRPDSLDMVYNWGVFDFRSEGFLVRFLQGDMRYTMDAQTIRTTQMYYQYLNRRIWAQELDLTPVEKRQLVDYVRWNYQPENRQYRYNYYLDNCSTRVRDVIDRAIGGSLRRYLQAIPTDQTYRSHSLRMLQRAPLLNVGIEMALGRPTDVPINADQASFLPVQLMGFVSNFKRDDGRPLVKRAFVLAEADRGPEPSHIPALWKALLPVGLVVAAVLLGLWFGAHARITSAVAVAIVAGFMGIIGTIIVLLVTVTDHVAAHSNENLWLLNPVWVIVAVALTRAMIGGRGVRVARWSAAIGVGLSLCAVLMHLVGLSRQPNWDVIAMLLPAQVAMALMAVRRLTPSPAHS